MILRSGPLRLRGRPEVAQVVYVDYRGHGRSDDGPRDRWSLGQLADDVVSLCGALGIERPVVYGQSLGAIVALMYATRHPGHPRALILVAASAVGYGLTIERVAEAFRRVGGDRAGSQGRLERAVVRARPAVECDHDRPLPHLRSHGDELGTLHVEEQPNVTDPDPHASLQSHDRSARMYEMYTIPEGATRVPATVARAQLADLVNRVAYGGEVVVLTRHGRALAALLPIDDSGRITVPLLVRAVGFKPSATTASPTQFDDTIAAAYQRHQEQADAP